MIEIKVNKERNVIFSFYSPCVPNEGETIWIANAYYNIYRRIWSVNEHKRTAKVTLMVE